MYIWTYIFTNGNQLNLLQDVQLIHNISFNVILCAFKFYAIEKVWKYFYTTHIFTFSRNTFHINSAKRYYIIVNILCQLDYRRNYWRLKWVTLYMRITFEIHHTLYKAFDSLLGAIVRWQFDSMITYQYLKDTNTNRALKSNI